MVVIAIVGGVIVYNVWLAPPGPRVIAYGDSLSAQSKRYFSELISADGGPDVTVRAFGGTAICDWLLPMEKDADELDPVAVVIEFVGNRRTDCMRSPDGGFLDEAAALEKYQRDLEIALGTWRTRGVPVYLVTAPAAVGEIDPVPLHATYAGAAERWGRGVELVDAAATLRGADGTYPARLRCLPSEAADEGCDNGTIAVRARDGVHFCDRVDGDGACTAYASGAFRFARAIADQLRRDLVE